MCAALNRIWNTQNPNQGEDTKVLCVCSAGLLRSPTMANVLHREFGYNTRAVGSVKSHALIPIEDVHIHWADVIVTSDTDCEADIFDEYKEIIRERNIPVYCLHIPDSYKYMDDDLQDIIVDSFVNTEYQS